MWRKRSMSSNNDDDTNGNSNMEEDRNQTEKKPFEYLKSDEEVVKWMMDEYRILSEVNEDDGLDFAGKTSMWITHERYLESSQRDENDRLFHDPLAKQLSGVYGERLSVAMMVAMKPIFDLNDTVGLGFDGHILYTAARTRLVNDCISNWLDDDAINNTTKNTTIRKQVINLGAGVDTRAFWLESLKKADLYIEVDTAPVLDFKQRVLDEINEAKNNDNDDDNNNHLIPFCQRKVVKMDSSKESVKDLPKHGVMEQQQQQQQQQHRKICWILEGLVMYLQKEEVEKLLNEISALCEDEDDGSLVMINFSTRTPASDPDTLDAIMLKSNNSGWKRTTKVFFGEDSFNYGRYPKGKPANDKLGFCIYEKNKKEEINCMFNYSKSTTLMKYCADPLKRQSSPLLLVELISEVPS